MFVFLTLHHWERAPAHETNTISFDFTIYYNMISLIEWNPFCGKQGNAARQLRHREKRSERRSEYEQARERVREMRWWADRGRLLAVRALDKDEWCATALQPARKTPCPLLFSLSIMPQSAKAPSQRQHCAQTHRNTHINTLTETHTQTHSQKHTHKHTHRNTHMRRG